MCNLSSFTCKWFNSSSQEQKKFSQVFGKWVILKKISERVLCCNSLTSFCLYSSLRTSWVPHVQQSSSSLTRFIPHGPHLSSCELRWHIYRWCEVAFQLNLTVLNFGRVSGRQHTCSCQRGRSLLPLWVLKYSFFLCVYNLKRWRNFSPGREAGLHFSRVVGHVKSSLLPKDDDGFVGVFGCLTLGQLGGLLRVCMADSLTG